MFDHVIMEPLCEHQKVAGLVGYANVIAGYIRVSVKITKFTSSGRPMCQDYSNYRVHKEVTFQ